MKKGAFSAAANAEVARGKVAGLYVEQRMVITAKLEDLSVEQLEDKMKKIYEDNKVLIEGDYQQINQIKVNAQKRQLFKEQCQSKSTTKIK